MTEGEQRIGEFMKMLGELGPCFRKCVLFVEYDPRARTEIYRTLRESEDPEFCIHAAQNLETAIAAVEDAGRIQYALIDERFPRARFGPAERLADELYDKVKERFPEAKIFAYTGEAEGLARQYAGVLLKKELTPEEACRKVIEAAREDE
ncbi:hypothetical protein KY363_03865 [Candidatus Woesearchaeota archaeon]|nr:hypothetical protein [Candidatus Woesearchaeota archaeon]